VHFLTHLLLIMNSSKLGVVSQGTVFFVIIWYSSLPPSCLALPLCNDGSLKAAAFYNPSSHNSSGRQVGGNELYIFFVNAITFNSGITCLQFYTKCHTNKNMSGRPIFATGVIKKSTSYFLVIP